MLAMHPLQLEVMFMIPIYNKRYSGRLKQTKLINNFHITFSISFRYHTYAADAN